MRKLAKPRKNPAARKPSGNAAGRSSATKRRAPRLLFIVDPWSTLDHAKDTTLRLVEEALALGAACAIAENRAIGLDAGVPHAETREVTAIAQPRTAENFRRAEARWEPVAAFDHVLYRTDPPIDLSYLLPLQILAAASRDGRGPKIHSSPASLFFLNEKWAPAELGPLFPKSLVSASVDRLSTFVSATGKCVLKPLYLAQSKGVEVLDARTFSVRTVRERLRLATEGERLPVIVQEFLPGVADGETRLWFVDGKLLAAVKKLPRAGETVIDMDRGGSIAPAKLGAAEKKAAAKIAALLRRHSVLYAAVDLIDGKVTDFNHTSPGLLVAMEELLGENLARRALRPLFRD